MRTAIVLSLLFVAATAFAEQLTAPPSPDAAQKPRQLAVSGKPWKGDFDQMLQRRVIRVLVPYSRTLFYNDKGRERGLSAELVRDFERFVNQKYAKDLAKRPLTVYIIPTTRDELVENVANGHGDIAAGNITVTEARLKLVDFVAPADQKAIAEVVLNNADDPAIASVDELSGKTVHVRKSSSYYQSLEALNARLKKDGKALVNLVLVPDELEDEDMMEMLNAGLLKAVVVDDWKAKIWAQVLPKVRINEQAAVRSGAQRGWVIRKNSPELERELQAFYKDFVKKTGVMEYRLKQAMQRVRQIKDNAAESEIAKFQGTIALFRKYGTQYNFDPLMLAAQGYQESQLDQNAKSHVGAIGVMQIMPATGKELKVGDIRITEANIHGGAKYMDQLMTRYFKDANFSPDNRALFAFASYNAGPGNISKMRTEAQKRGLAPDKWFNNVELVTAEKIGIETTTYVRNIYKYYVSYKRTVENIEAAKKAREQVAPGTK
jgi:membrane-bound lytic murein transglycosylase MltF